ncbi:mRNA-capping enzyme subunit beta, partial [Neolecta irregularis DAH-3]
LPGPPPIDDFTQRVINFLGPFCADFAFRHLEVPPPAQPPPALTPQIEAKLGTFVHPKTRQRIALPFQSEGVIHSPQVDANFRSTITPKQHFHFNQLLNQQVVHGLTYSHSKLVDNFHPDSSSTDRRGPLIRVTTVESTSEIKQCVQKKRLANLDVYSPNDLFDWRISVNSEIPVNTPSTPSLRSRRKDRRTYNSSFARIDLTEVIAAEEKSWELEMEIEDLEDLRLHAVRYQSGKENRFGELVKLFVEQFRAFVTRRIDA